MLERCLGKGSTRGDERRAQSLRRYMGWLRHTAAIKIFLCTHTRTDVPCQFPLLPPGLLPPRLAGARLIASAYILIAILLPTIVFCHRHDRLSVGRVHHRATRTSSRARSRHGRGRRRVTSDDAIRQRATRRGRARRQRPRHPHGVRGHRPSASLARVACVCRPTSVR